MPTSKHRKLAAILFADIVGYTALMQKDENKASLSLHQFQDCIENQVASFHGRIIHFYGDGALCTFSNPLEAVQCAMALQVAFGQEPRVPVRIGIHSGVVVEEAGKVYGNSINVASRIESMGIAGAILLSKKVNLELINHKELSTSSLGTFDFKNVTEPMELFALSNDGLPVPSDEEMQGKGEKKTSNIPLQKPSILIALGLMFLLAYVASQYFFRGSTFSLTSEDENLTRIAVLPFKIQTGSNTDLDYLSEGFMDLLSTRINGIEGMVSIDPVISNAIYKRKKKQVLQAVMEEDWAELKTDYIISGSFIKLGSSYNIIGNLVNLDGKILGEVIQPCNDIDSLFTSADIFTRSLLSQVLKNENQNFTNLALQTTDNYDALNEYLKGEQARREGKWQEAHVHYKQATELDSTFALAWLRWFNNLGYYDPIPNGPLPESVVKAKLNDYIDKLTPQQKDYVEVLNITTSGDISRAINKAENNLGLYGDNVDVLFLLGDLIFHCNFLLNKSRNESRHYFEKILKYDDNYLEAKQHLFEIVFSEKNPANIEDLIKKYPEEDPYPQWGTIGRFFAKNKLRELMRDSFPQYFSFISLYAYFQLGRVDTFLYQYDQVKDQLKDSLSDFSILDYTTLIIQGKFQEAFDKYPYFILNNWFGTAYGITDKSFQPYNHLILDSLIEYISTESDFRNTHKWHVVAQAIYFALNNDTIDFQNNINVITSQRENNKGKSRNSSFDFLYYRMKFIEHRFINKNNENALVYLDSLFNNLVDWPDFGAYTIFYPGYKFAEAELLLEYNNLNASLDIFESLRFSSHTSLYHAPLQYKIGYILDKKGETTQAYHRFKYFLSIYKDCDPFYQDNVKYAQKKVAEYEDAMK